MKDVGVRTAVLEAAKMEVTYSFEMLVSFHQKFFAPQKTVI